MRAGRNCIHIILYVDYMYVYICVCVCVYMLATMRCVDYRLAIATRRGFAIVDTESNSCLYILSSSTSILCKNPLY